MPCIASTRFTAFCTTGSNSSKATHNRPDFCPTQIPRQLQDLVLRGLVQHERAAHEHAVLALRACSNDGAKEVGRGGGRPRRVEEKEAIAMDELAMRQAEGIAELPDLDRLEDAAVSELGVRRRGRRDLLERVLAFEEELALLVVGLDAADVFALGGLEDGDEVVELLLELGADGGFECGGGEWREERGQEGGGGGGHELVAMM